MLTQLFPSPVILVVGTNTSLLELLEIAFLGKLDVRHVHHPDETEGLHVGLVVIDDSFADETLRHIRVHPKLNATPVIVIGGTITPNDGLTWVIDRGDPEVGELLTEHIHGLLSAAA